MILEHAAISVKGKDHMENEDTYVVDAALNLYAVMDGVSIPAGGGEAARLVGKLLPDAVRKYGKLGDAILHVNQLVNRARKMRECGYTTITAMLIKNNAAELCWVGDSMAYLIRDGKAKMLTTLEDLRGGVLLQAIGEEHIRVHERKVELEKGDVVVLATDGISSILKPEDIASVVSKAREASHICRELVKLAEKKERSYRDDKTTVVAVLR